MIPVLASGGLSASQVLVTDADKKLTSLNGSTTNVSILVTLPSTTNTFAFTKGILTNVS